MAWPGLTGDPGDFCLRSCSCWLVLVFVCQFTGARDWLVIGSPVGLVPFMVVSVEQVNRERRWVLL